MRHLTRTEDEKRQLAQEVVDYLNEVLALDPEALYGLIENRVPCNEALTNHATTQVSNGRVGLLGILNGLVGVRSDAWGYITAVYADEEPEQIERFTLTATEPLPAQDT